MKSKAIDKCCNDCGFLMIDVHYGKKYCPECAANRKRLSVQKYERKYSRPERLSQSNEESVKRNYDYFSVY